MGQYIGYAILGLLVAGMYIFGGWYSYRYLTEYFNWPKWLVVSLSLGGFLTGWVVMRDQFKHTSMAGDNTRTWKDDPENGVYIIPLKDAHKLKVVEPPDDAEDSDHA